MSEMTQGIRGQVKRLNTFYQVASLAYVVRSFLPPSPVIIEAGAHNGLDTRWLCKLRRNSMVHAFEPLPNLYSQLTSRTERYKNVRRYNLALSETSGSARMHVSAGTSDASSSLHSPKEHLTLNPTVYFQDLIDVPIITLDDWAEQFNVRHADFLWLDMQGHELAALKGGSRLLDTVSSIYTEVSLVEIYEGAPLYPELRYWLEQHGFRAERERIYNSSSGDVFFQRRT